MSGDTLRGLHGQLQKLASVHFYNKCEERKNFGRNCVVFAQEVLVNQRACWQRQLLREDSENKKTAYESWSAEQIVRKQNDSYYIKQQRKQIAKIRRCVGYLTRQC